ncbi:MAG: co-chaperone GroES family protein [Planctomycetes bacterium]|nr:co-chaperone GroES family protein [Planctomycetota bacterium]MCC7395923.1 co-chaperone GroES [Planctomycetota bacterium]
MKRGNKQLLVVGDRVLVEPSKAETQTKVGLFLPAGVVEKEDVRAGVVVAVGPGQPLPPPQDEQEPWKEGFQRPRFLPMQVKIGDTALFFRKAAIEISFEGEPFLVVPYGAILVLVRGDSPVPDQLPPEL